MPQRCVAIGGSAGSIEVLRDLLASLPSDLQAPVLAVVHLPPDTPSRLATVLGRRSRLPVEVAVDGTPIRDGTVYVAPPDRHLTLADGHVVVRRGPRHNRHRPSIDPLFWSVGQSVGGGAVGIILSGAPGDGVAGARELAQLGGAVLVQDPDDALFPGMPERVLAAVPGARAVPVETLGQATLDALAASRPSVRQRSDGDAMIDDRRAPREPAGRVDAAATYGCPDCGGVLSVIGPSDELRFRCRIGHEFDGDGLLRAQAIELEDALWAAVRGLEEQSDLATRVARHHGDGGVRDGHLAHAKDTRGQAEAIRAFLVGRPVGVVRDLEVEPLRTLDADPTR